MDKVQIVAEIGVNHNGDMELAKLLIGAAQDAGADAVKTQLFATERLVSANAKKAVYQQKVTGGDDSQFGMLKELELSVEQYSLLDEYAKSLGILFFAAPFDIGSVRALGQLGCPIIKIPSGEITNLPYLLEIARLNRKTYMSTGMSTMGEVIDALNVLTRDKPLDLTLLHCHTQYPTDFRDVNLAAIASMRKTTGLPVGYSDHTPGIEAPIAAATLGAVVIEKHLTLDNTLPGPDHQASLEPGEFRKMARAIRNIEKAMGDGIKRRTQSERENLTIARKSIVAARHIRRGEIITEDMITTKRPGNGISPMRWNEIVGSAAKLDYKPDEMI